MLATDFVSVYPRDPIQPAEGSPYAEVLGPADDWSNRFGEMLHDRLSNPHGPPIELEENFAENYQTFIRGALRSAHALISQSDSNEALMANNQLNFHRLNGPMMYLWMAIANPRLIGNDQLYSFIPTMQDVLAISGFELYISRQKAAGRKLNYAYFSQENTPRRSSIEGIGNEFDAGTVMMEIMRKNKDLVIVPGPNQFEHNKFSGRKNRNVDFVVLSKNARAVGVQVKSQVTPKDKQEYDSRRVVLIDAKLDLGNQIAVRTKSSSSDVSVVTWSGIISSQRVLGFSVHGQHGQYLKELGLNDKAILRRKWLAKQLVGDLKPKLSSAAQVVGDRIRERL